MSAQAQVVDSEAAQKSSLTSEFPLYVAPQPSDNADILDPEFPGEGTGDTPPSIDDAGSICSIHPCLHMLSLIPLLSRENSDA